MLEQINGTDLYFKPIYNGRYEVGSDGNVYTTVKYKKKTAMIGKVANSGYRMVVLTFNGKKIYKNVHRLVAEAFIPNSDDKREVNHIDGNKLNNAVENLEWVTTRENQLHNRDVLRCMSKAKLSMEKANEIRDRYAKGGVTQIELAEQYGVKKSIIGQILTNKRWVV